MSVQGVSNLKPIKVPHAVQNSAVNVQIPNPVVLNNEQQNKPKQKLDLLKKFETEVKNSCDMNDTIEVPRTIFKGYLAFMAGTSLGAINSLIKVGEKGQNKKIKTVLALASTVISLFGTWSFVRPYVIKNSQKKG